MIVKCYGKINLSLDVVGKREDGYHLLEMVMQTVDLYDTITLTKLQSGIEISCSKPYVPNNEKNIAYKAAELSCGNGERLFDITWHERQIP